MQVMVWFSFGQLRSGRRGGTAARAVLAFVCSCTRLQAQQTPDLADMSVEDLLNVRVITAGKTEQKLSQTPAAVYVITAEDIRRAGLTSIPEALRLAPGVEVAQINSTTWAIAMHGFNSHYSNKLLVLIDGRSVYSSIIAQVFWSIQDFPLDDVERIEVIRGPGGSVWGANATDGVINIITRSAKQSQGGVVSVTGGSHDNAVIDVRYGSLFGREGAYRISARYANRGAFDALAGGSDFDHSSLERLSSRIDLISEKNSFTGEGDLFQVDSGETLLFPTLVPPATALVNLPVSYGGGTALLRWEHRLNSGAKTAFQTFYDREDLSEAGLKVVAQTLDIDFQHQLRLLEHHDLVWGGGLRIVRQDSSGASPFQFDPATSTPKLFNIFGQDDVTILPPRLRLTLGSKLEHNDYTGFEVEPTARLLWAVRPGHSFWSAASRAVRSPATFERGGQLTFSSSPGPDGVPLLTRFVGSSQFTSESLTAFEAGYRGQPGKSVSMDIAAFYNLYRNLSGVTMGLPFLETTPEPVHVVVPFVFGNTFRGRTFGSETSITYTPAPFWRLSGSYSWLRMYYLSEDNPMASPTFNAGANPSYQTQAHSFLTLRHKLELDTSVYYASSLPEQRVAGHTRLDVRFGWSPRENLQLTAGFQNILDPRHLEFSEPPLPPVPGKIPRSAFGKAVWRF